MGRDAIADLIMWSVGKREQVNIREDKWLKRGIMGGPANKNDPKIVSKLINGEENAWNEQAIQGLLGDQIANEILKIPLRNNVLEDKIVWTGTKSSDFSVKSAYNVIRTEATKPTAIKYQPPFSPHGYCGTEFGICYPPKK